MSDSMMLKIVFLKTEKQVCSLSGTKTFCSEIQMRLMGVTINTNTYKLLDNNFSLKTILKSNCLPELAVFEMKYLSSVFPQIHQMQNSHFNRVCCVSRFCPFFLIVLLFENCIFIFHVKNSLLYLVIFTD